MKNNLITQSVIWLTFMLIVSLLLTESTFENHCIYVLLITASYLFCVRTWIKSGCRAISLYSFFISYAFLCNCGQSVLFVLGVPQEFLTAYYGASFEYMTQALRFQCICIAALNFGTSLALKHKTDCVSTETMRGWYNGHHPIHDKNDKLLFYLMIVFLLGTLYSAFEVARVRSTMSYMEWMYEGSKTVNTRFYFMYFYMFLSLRSVLRKQYVVFIYVCWLFFILLYMMLGLRTQAIPYVSLFIITLPLTNERLFDKKFIPLWIVGVITGIIFLGVISSTRTGESVNLSETSSGQGPAVSFYTSMADIGVSANTIANAMDLCDKGMPHYQSILYSVASVIPQRVLKIPVSDIFNVSNAITSPGSYASEMLGTPGAGYSFMAEAFLNFGWMGWLYLILYGFLIARLENIAYRDFIQSQVFFKITFLLFLSKQVFYARAELCLSEDYIEYMVFTAILYKILSPKSKLLSI